MDGEIDSLHILFSIIEIEHYELLRLQNKK